MTWDQLAIMGALVSATVVAGMAFGELRSLVKRLVDVTEDHETRLRVVEHEHS